MRCVSRRSWLMRPVMTVDRRYRARSSMMVVGVLLTVTLGLRPPDTRLEGKGVSVGDSKEI